MEAACVRALAKAASFTYIMKAANSTYQVERTPVLTTRNDRNAKHVSVLSNGRRCRKLKKSFAQYRYLHADEVKLAVSIFRLIPHHFDNPFQVQIEIFPYKCLPEPSFTRTGCNVLRVRMPTRLKNLFLMPAKM